MRVRETFPDRVLDQADQVVLVDLTPEELQLRLRAREGLSGPRGRAGAHELLQAREPGRAARARPPRGGRGRRGTPPSDRPRPDGGTPSRRADPRARHAPGALATAAPARVAFRAAAPGRAGHPLDPPARSEARRAGSGRAGCAPAAGGRARRALPRGGGGGHGRDRARGGRRPRDDVPLHPTPANVFPTSSRGAVDSTSANPGSSSK